MLHQAGYNALPAANIANASLLVAELNAVVDLVLINGSIRDADSFLSNQRRSKGDLAVIALMDHHSQGDIGVPDADLTEYHKGELDEDARQEWASIVHTVISAKAVARWQGQVTRP